LKGLDKIEPNREFLKQEIKNHPEMMAEAWQLKMKLAGDEKAYEKIKALTRGREVGPTSLGAGNYIGLAEKITDQAIRGLR